MAQGTYAELEQLAQWAHEAVCEAVPVMPHWPQMTKGQKQLAIDKAKFYLLNPDESAKVVEGEEDTTRWEAIFKASIDSHRDAFAIKKAPEEIPL